MAAHSHDSCHVNKRSSRSSEYELLSQSVEPSSKKAKKDADSAGGVHKPLTSFEGFKISKILSSNAQNKSTFLHGKFDGSSDDAIVLLEKTPFPEAAIEGLLCGDTTLNLILENDIYRVYDGLPNQELGCNRIKTTVIYPATERHIQKYTDQAISLIEETWDDYCNITLPYLQGQAFKIQWVYNILEKKAEEVERIIFDDPDPQDGFVLLPDMKWDRKQLANLYLVAICYRRDIKSLRDLNVSHLSLLRNIRHKCQETVKEKYSVAPDQLRMYIHYQPSYYHFHVHVTHLKFDAPGSGVTKAHLLSDVIENIQLVPDYYQRKTLSCVLRDTDKLLRFREARETK